jgi:hypothetical protein
MGHTWTFAIAILRLRTLLLRLATDFKTKNTFLFPEVTKLMLKKNWSTRLLLKLMIMEAVTKA